MTAPTGFGPTGVRTMRWPGAARWRCTGFTWIIEGDVKACFDEISHKAILRCVREKVMDNKFLDLIQLLLKAGVEIDGVVHPTTKGVPQGGVVSPLLANIVLNKLDWFLHSKGFHGDGQEQRVRCHGLPNVRFCPLCRRLVRVSHAVPAEKRAERLRDEIRDFLRETCGLELSAEKTRITHVRDGYDFLGFNISVGVGKSGKFVPKVRVGRKAITNIQTRLGEVLRYRPMQESISVRLERASAVIRGWSNYFKIAHNFSQVAHGLDHKAFWIAVKAICRKEDISTAQCLRKYRLRNTIGVHEDCTLARFQDTAATYYCASPEPYQPGCQPAVPGRRRMGGGFRPPTSVGGQAAETSSGRLWFATAFTAVGARSWLHPRPRTRTISNLSTALPTSTWRTAWTTSRRFVCDATSSKPRGKNESRIIWKAGCLETCTSGLGLGSG